MAGGSDTVIYQGILNRSLVDLQDLSLVTSDGILCCVSGQVLTAILATNQFTATVAPDGSSLTLSLANPCVMPGSLTVNGTTTLGSTSGLLKRVMGEVKDAVAGTDYVKSLSGTTEQISITGTDGVLTASLPSAVSIGYLTVGNVNSDGHGYFTYGVTTSGAGSIQCGGNLQLPNVTGSSLAMLNASSVITNVTLGPSLNLSGSSLNLAQDIRTSATPSFLGVALTGLTASSLVFTNASKNLSTPLGAGTSTQYLRGDATWATLNQAAIPDMTTSSAVTFNSVTASDLSAYNRLTLSGLTANRLLVTGGISPCTALASGTSSQFLRGDLTWQTISSGVTSITGTANQVIASASTGAVTLSLPQSIATTSTPQFGRLGIGGASPSNQALAISASISGGTNTHQYGIVLSPALTITNSPYGAYYHLIYGSVTVPAGGTSGGVWGLYVDGNGITKTGGTPTYAYGAQITSPNVSATNCIGVLTDSLGVGIGGAWTDRASANGTSWLNGITGIGVQPTTDRALYVSNGNNNPARIYTQYSALYPARSTAGASNWYGHVVYSNPAYLSGSASVTVYGYYGMDTSGPSSYVGTAYSAYFRDPNLASTATNNYALYADNLSVGGTGNKVTSGIYSAGGIKIASTGTTLTQVKTSSTKTLKPTFNGNNTSTPDLTYKYTIIGNVCTLWINTYNQVGVTGTSQLTFTLLDSETFPNNTGPMQFIKALNAGTANTCLLTITNTGVVTIGIGATQTAFTYSGGASGAPAWTNDICVQYLVAGF